MAYRTVLMSGDPTNNLPGGIAGVALVVGDLVYMDSNGAYQKAQSILWGNVTATRIDAVGVCHQIAQANEFISPVKALTLGGFSGLTIGAKVYLSITAGGYATSAPGKIYVEQCIGFAVKATEVSIDIIPGNAVASIGTGMDIPVFTGAAAAVTIDAGNLCGITDNTIVKADASTGAVIEAQGVALAEIAPAATGTIYDNVNIVVSGKTAGTPLWTGETAGAIDEAAPSDTGDLIQPIGITVGAISQIVKVGRNPSLSA